jgi:uncharacterized protein YfdQ (DUF2303 family)
MADTTRTENDALIELAREAAVSVDPVPDAEHLQEVVLPPDHEYLQIDLECFQATPRRKRERVELHEAGSFADYVVRHTGSQNGPGTPYALYADLDHAAIVAVLDDSSRDQPGWGEHRASLKLRTTKSWDHWKSLDGKPLTQEQFAEHIEAGLQEITAPPALDMYELAQTFQATVGAKFRQQGRLANGQRALHYEEVVDAGAGEQGDLEIPKEFRLQLVPFEGGPDYELVARLRFKVREAKLTFTYILVRPEDVLRAAFGETLNAIEKGTGIVAFRGTPPARLVQ